jgi:hypothetical protein
MLYRAVWSSVSTYESAVKTVVACGGTALVAHGERRLADSSGARIAAGCLLAEQAWVHAEALTMSAADRSVADLLPAVR